MNSRTTSARVRLYRLVRRLRWLIAAPVLRPILRELEEMAKDASTAARMTARSELNRVHAMEVEQAFGCTSFDETTTIGVNSPNTKTTDAEGKP